MPSPRLSPPATAQPGTGRGDAPLYIGLAFAALVGLGLPLAVALGASDTFGSLPAFAGRHAATWVDAQQVRGTTLDGEMVHLRVALDAPDAGTREFVHTHRDQVALLMQASLSEQDTARTAGAERVRALADGIEERLNGYLQARQIEPVRAVVIEDLVIGRGATTAGRR